MAKTKKTQEISKDNKIMLTSSIYEQNIFGYEGWDLTKIPRYLFNYSYIASSENSQKLASSKLYLQVPKPNKKTLKIANYKKAIKPLYKKSMEYGENYITITDSEHPLVALMNYPTPLYTSYQFLYRIFMILQNYGDCYIYKQRENGQIVSLIEFPPTEMKIQIAKDGLTIDYYYLMNNRGKKIDVNDVIRISLPSPYKRFYGLGCMEAAWNQILMTYNKQISDISRQKNSERPDIYINFPSDTSEEEMIKITEMWSNKLQGNRNHGKLIATNLSTPPTIEQIQQETPDIGDPESVIKTIFGCYKYPYAKFASVDSNRASAIVSNNQWISNISDFAGIVEDALNSQLLPEFPKLPPGSCLEFSDLREEDPQEDFTKWLELWKATAIDKDEFREHMGLEVRPQDIGVVYVAPKTNTGI
jgi:HK97 family phage portal protein